MEAQDKVRIDKWLWHARFCKTRTHATEFVTSKSVRVNRAIVRKPSQPVRVGDVLTIPRGRTVVVVRILGLGERRGPAAEAQGLYDELVSAD